jgi:uncharacterized protein
MSFIRTVLLFFLVFQNVQSTELPDFPFIYSIGKAVKEVPPNTVKLTFNVEAFDENPDKSYQTVRNRSLEILQLLNKFRIMKQDIESYEINKETVHQEKDSTELNIVGYKVTQKFSIKINQLSQYTQLINELLVLRNITDFDSEFDVIERSSIESELIGKAVENAKNRAEIMSKGSGREIDSAYAVSEHEFYMIDNEFGIGNIFSDAMFRKSMMGGNENITYIPSTIKLEKRVNVIFKLKD